VPPIRPRGSLGRGAHERILTAAETLFARRGINATSMHDLHVEARVSKRTLYQHFAGKDELVLAVLAAQQEGGATAVLTRGELAPRARLLELFTALAEQPRPLRGDPFVNAAVEFPEPSHPAHRAAAEHASRCYTTARRSAPSWRTIPPAPPTPTRSPPQSCATRSTDHATAVARTVGGGPA